MVMKLPKNFYNPLSLSGSLLASVSLGIILFSLISMLLFDVGGSYIGLFIYIILPVFLVIGLLMIPVGMWRRVRKLKRTGKEEGKKGIRIDLNDKRHLNAIGIFLFVSVIFLFLTGIGSYEAFHYTESNEFCGTLCHTVMEPEWVAYQESTHSRVNCVECHVGTGASWYVRSKLSGLYQVYSVVFNKYPQPIPTPVHNLRPARETCERCHWPNKFYSYRLRNEKHFLADPANTEWNIQLKMKIGSDFSAKGLTEGIHWHINPDIKVEYISSTYDREFIPWVRYINTATGDTLIYNDILETLDQEATDTLEIRTMDCIDCHNRPSHNYLPPQEFTDLLIASGDIPLELPEVKTLAMEVLNNSYHDKDSAEVFIRNRIREFYETNYRELSEKNPELIEKAYAGFMTGFSKNIFPAMKASWDVYPNHIGHVEFNGCFRCHNGNHESNSGEIISRDCNLCHTILGQGTAEDYELTSVNSSLEFKHPVDIGESWKEFTCTDCHRYLY